MLDVKQVRSHFPALESGVIHFDNPGGTQIAREALERMRDYLVNRNANHGGAFRSSRESDAMVVEARRALADLFSAARPEEISFGQNMTSLTLHVSRSIARELSPGDEIVLTRLDHDANVTPWVLLARDCRCTVRWVDFDPETCAWSIRELERQLGKKTKLVAVGYASNATGTISPVAEAVKAAHSVGALCFVDAVHYAPHGRIDVSSLGCDLMACSAYKFFGPHIGILYGKYELMDRLSAYKVRPAGDAPPDKWETGTQSFESIAGALGAVEYLEWVGRAFGSGAPASQAGSRPAALRAGMCAIRSGEQNLSRAMLDGLTSVGGLKIHGITDPARFSQRAPTFAFTMDGLHPKRICERLDQAGICASDGNYYALEVTTRLGLEASGGMVRTGAVHYNTVEEIEKLVDVLGAIRKER
ncbi:MAG TPA: cysteine desulfurase-like protein [Spirochaetia bacterium]|nr:cysteine desulfurase-like protein [Spirochaetia bacterium]